jgi:hypothetical protein
MEHCEECGALKCVRMNARQEILMFFDWCKREKVDLYEGVELHDDRNILDRYLFWVSNTPHECPMPYRICCDAQK